ncbi:NUDIX hydrolase [Streptomyces sp. ODS28]|uniref:NUDIX hydrolase n=1 Tax=Streptomyces sp. ODS28 TaxID=3136688 RepID=UPI0031ED9D1A
MPEPAPAPPLATGPRGMALLGVYRLPEGHEFSDAPVAYALVILRHEGRCLMAYQRQRGLWELPGGGIDPGETPREAAVRELWEETGQRVAPDSLHFACYTRTALGVEQNVLYGAVFTAEAEGPLPFVPNEEVSALHWRQGEEPMPGGGAVQTVDEYLVRVCKG